VRNIISAPERLIQGEHSTEPKKICPHGQHPRVRCKSEWLCSDVVKNKEAIGAMLALTNNYCLNGCACDSGNARTYNYTACIPKKDCHQNKIDHENDPNRRQEYPWF
uniref:Uncharacterized protein n=1 Tax=Romanomermis culicivorax TaxID=13658 RepID=A0A915KMN4_ROMCU